MDLVLIRHPAPAIDEGVCYGSADLPLAGDARQAADALLARAAALDVPLPRAVWTSPLTRCARVAYWLARRLQCVEQPDARLREIDFGAWERRRWDAIGRAALDAWAADLLHARSHGGESVAQFAARAGSWFEAWRAQPAASLAGCTWVVTHAGVMRVLAARMLGQPIEVTLRRPIDMNALVWLRGEATGERWRVVRWNA